MRHLRDRPRRIGARCRSEGGRMAGHHRALATRQPQLHRAAHPRSRHLRERIDGLTKIGEPAALDERGRVDVR